MTDHPLFVSFFMLGAIAFFLGLAGRFSIYWQGQWKVSSLVRGVLSTLLSWRIVELAKTAILDGILQRRLFGQDKLRWLMKVLIMIAYPGILITGHLKVELMPQFERFPHLIRFFYAPFVDFYFLRDLGVSSLSLSDALFAVFFDLFGAMTLMGELIAIYRRFVLKTVAFPTSAGDILAVNLLGGWFILRFFCEAITILTYSIPDSVAQYWFVAFGLSKLMWPLALPWSTLNYPLWSLSGLFLATLVASIPFNRKLWHIVTIPVTMFINLMPKEAFQPGTRKAPLPVSVKELIAMDSCVKCGSCVDVCQVYKESQQLEATMGGFLSDLKSSIMKTYGLAATFGRFRKPRPIEEGDVDLPYLCTLCGRCESVCPAYIDTKRLRIAARGYKVQRGRYPQVIDVLAERLKGVHNILGEALQDRPIWIEALEGIPNHRYQKERAKVVYFVGCVGSYFPMTKRIPQSFVKILDKVGVDFTILGGEEWCCGWPLIAAGLEREAEALMEHNLEKVREKGAETVVFACPSCYHMWKGQIKEGLEILHSTELLKKLIDEGKITFMGRTTKVTYHDPCDLGRASGVYEAPRKILQAIPGVELVELRDHREKGKCCGGGGDLEMIRPALSAALAQAKIEEIKATGADMVVSACQQCLRTILTTARRKKIPIVAMDITEFVLKSMNE